MPEEQSWTPEHAAPAHPQTRAVEESLKPLSEAEKNSPEFKNLEQDVAFEMIKESEGKFLPAGVRPERSVSGYLLDQSGEETDLLPSQVIPPSEVTEWQKRVVDQFEWVQ